MNTDPGGSKWKMEFARDESKLLSLRNKKETATSSKVVPKQYIFANDSDDSDDDRKKTVVHPPPPPPTNDKTKRRGQTPSASKYKSSMDYNKSANETHQTKQTAVKSGPVVLDKFGNFRLATMDTSSKPPEPPNSPRKTSRSRSRGRKYSRSSSRSRSRGKRSRSGSYARKYSRSRSRSRSFRSRSRSRSHSRSYSRSRSRSRSLRRHDKRYSSRRGGYGERGTYYKPRFSTHPRGRGRGTFSRDFREFRGRDRARPYRPRQRGGSSRFYRNYREDSRERRFSSRERSGDERRSFSNERPRSPAGENEKKGSPPVIFVKEDVHSVDIEGRWADDKIDKSNNDGQSLADIEKLITKAKKENKEDMIERNKDLVKKNPSYKF